MPSFKNFAELEKYLNSKINVAVEAACKRILDELQKIIVEEYYDEFTPVRYQRSYRFLASATTKMLNQLCGEIFMDKDVMDYPTYWNGEIQLAYASEGYHGSLNIQTEGRFWETFIDFMQNESKKILKEELVKQGVPLK